MEKIWFAEYKKTGIPETVAGAGCRKKSKISEINKWVENGDKSFSKNIYKD